MARASLQASVPNSGAHNGLFQLRDFWALTFGTIGVVYGDIGTSPLYAMRESVLAAGGGSEGSNAEIILGILSLIIWALILVVTAKYVLLLLRADNDGEGGTFALMALAQRAVGGRSLLVLSLGIVAAALFYGDAMLTPAVSVLSAVEGLEVTAPSLQFYVVPLTVIILVALFALQSRGTAKVAALFAPITLIWFAAIAAAGLWHISQNITVLQAFIPGYGISFLMNHGLIGFLTLGAVFLAVTGAEALYADLGHFGRMPIQTAWLSVVLPALTINYLGQGALLLSNPHAVENPFFLLYPHWALLPMIVLATAATVIASQAVITGAFSLTSQAIQLGFLPRLEVRHTSGAQFGQIYVPRINAILLIGVLLLVTQFRSSSALAEAYGVAVSGTMVVTTLMATLVIWKSWKWTLWATAALMVPLLLIDTTFLSANLLKIFHGGWIPLLIGTLVMLVIFAWRKGANILAAKTRRLEIPIQELVESLERRSPARVPGTAVFLTGDPDSVPTALLHSLKHYKVLHEHNVVLTVVIENIPYIKTGDRVSMEALGSSFSRVRLRFGFMEEPNVPRALGIARKQGWSFDIMSTSFFLSRRSVRPDAKSGMAPWQDRIFILLARNADDASSYFRLPTDRVVEIGTQVSV